MKSRVATAECAGRGPDQLILGALGGGRAHIPCQSSTEISMTDMSFLPATPEQTARTAIESCSSEAPSRAPAISKSACVIKMLRRAKGATLAELQEATSWQPHSVRAFLSGLRKKGSTISKEQRKSGETAYRLADKAAWAAAADA